MTGETHGLERSPFHGLDRSSLPFWEAAATGKLRIQQCNACSEHYFYPRPFCPFCASRDVEWIDCSGRGTVYTYTLLSKTKPSPSIIAWVTLEEGPSVLSRLEGIEPGDDYVGLPVQAVFASGPAGRPLLLFERR